MPQLLSMDSPFPEQQHTLRLLEPSDSCHTSLWNRLFARTYSKPFIIDSGLQRRLQFDLFTIQSAMHREHPDRLVLAYTRKMMAFLLFNRTPARILLLGLGGGSLAKFCYRRLPYTAITTVEVNPDVIALREAFRIPADDDRFRVICTDAAEYVARLGLSQDVILADACDRDGIAPTLNAIEFYRNAHRCLFSGGVFVANICGDPDHSAEHVGKIRAVFGDDIMTLQVRPDGNVIAFAFKGPRPEIDWEQMEMVATDLKRKFGLDFPRYIRRIAINWKLRRWQPVFACPNPSY
jgi:spermidine synthase